MANYGKFIYYKRNSAPIQTEYVSNSLELQYNITAYVTATLSLLYNILGIDARTLWAKKTPGKALWEPLAKAAPAKYPRQGVPVVPPSIALMTEEGEYFMTEAGAYLTQEY